MSEHTCLICGKPFTRVGAFGGQVSVMHDQCQRDMDRWRTEAWRLIMSDEEIRAASDAIEAAQKIRDDLYRQRMLDAGMPEWFANSRVEDLYDR